MRDPERIEVLLNTLRVVWEANPDLRLGQIMVIATKPRDPTPEIFNIEDELLLQGLLEYQATSGQAGSGA